MSRPRKMKREEKENLQRAGLDWKKYLIVRNTVDSYILWNKETESEEELSIENVRKRK